MRFRLSSAVVFALALALVGGCGSSSPGGNGLASKSPTEVVAAAKEHAARA